ncbi:MAG: carboxynorspermidine decarboxylase [Lachnospiraceae bacterium]|nr:carboxynorspermidine decarboxylase [Lachnospiraceae bacterium]
MYRVYPLIASYLDGTTASGIYETRLSHEEFFPAEQSQYSFTRDDNVAGDCVINGSQAAENDSRVTDNSGRLRKNVHVNALPENHVFEPAYDPSEMKELCEMCSHIYFNSISQLELHRPVWEPYQKAGKVKIALRINPEYSTQEGHAIYDPCSSGSRLGIRKCDLPDKLPEGVTGLHFHTLCEQNVQPLVDTFSHIEEKFAEQLKQIEWINMGGGHHITRDDYEISRLESFLKDVKDRYGFQIYLEPGEAIALNAGTLITKVMDIVNSDDIPTLILDASAACHMPDVLEMPYTPPLAQALESRPGTEPFSPDDAAAGNSKVATGAVRVRLASRTCLAGDVIGIYRLPAMPAVGDILTFGDMAIYSMVKNNTFNGMPLPDIVLEKDSADDDRYELVKRFGYEDFKERL